MYTIVTLIVILLIIIGMMFSLFNRFVRNRNLVKAAWSNIDVALKRRHDVITNLINTVNGYTTPEQATY